jgi:hypothetical protein
MRRRRGKAWHSRAHRTPRSSSASASVSVANNTRCRSAVVACQEVSNPHVLTESVGRDAAIITPQSSVSSPGQQVDW